MSTAVLVILNDYTGQVFVLYFGVFRVSRDFLHKLLECLVEVDPLSVAEPNLLIRNMVALEQVALLSYLLLEPIRIR